MTETAVRADLPKKRHAETVVQARARCGDLKEKVQALADRQRDRRVAAACRYRDLAEKNRDARILVVLHLFYFELWEAVRSYLENLSDYDYELVVTFPRELADEAVLSAVREFRKGVRLLPYPNKGFDVGPFVDVLNAIDLDRYDVVFKLQTKGCSRAKAYSYGQFFRYTDWFRQLYDGILDADNVHRVIDGLRNGDFWLAAAGNLIIPDPYYRMWYVRRYCRRLGISCPEDYRYVAGTCFAARAEALRPIRRLGLTISDFALSRRGVFTFGHALERIVCFAAAGKMRGFEVEREDLTAEAADYRANSPRIQLLEDGRFQLNPDYELLDLEPMGVDSYAVSRVRLGDLDFGVSAECKYLKDGDGDMCEWCRTSSVPEALKLPVVEIGGNRVLEGVCRCRKLLERLGPDAQINVVAVEPSTPIVRRCVRPESVTKVVERIMREFPLQELHPVKEDIWKSDTVLMTMFFEGVLKDGRRCFVKYVPQIFGSVETEWKFGRQFHALLPENAVEPLYCHVYENGSAIIAYEFLSGRTLRELIGRNEMDPSLAAYIAEEMADIANALQKMRVCHRDIHPDNLILSDAGHLKLIDFQFVISLDDTRETPFTLKNWELVLFRLGQGLTPACGVWNDRCALVACIDMLPDFPEKDRICERIQEEEAAVDCRIRVPLLMRLGLLWRYWALARRNFRRRRHGRPERDLELMKFCLTACFGWKRPKGK